MSNMDSPNNKMVDEREEEEEVQLPGFRFHPTDEELVGFYLRRKVDMKPISIELIKPIDIYKYDPWDLPKSSCTSGDKEWYFFCKRGRKYKNSVRPNRVTGSGFWKATGIDKPVHSQAGQNNININNNCIGLKKTLVYYRGSAGKGTKTDWMMHEFRLPSINNASTTDNLDTNTLQEAEIWTLCRIFKRNVSYRKYTPDWRELSTKRSHPNTEIANRTYKKCNSMDREASHNHHYIDFSAPKCHEEKKPALINHMNNNYNIINTNNVNQYNSMASINSAILNNNNNNNNNNPCNMDYSLSSTLFPPTFPDENDPLFSGYNNWDELRAVVEYAFDTPTV